MAIFETGFSSQSECGADTDWKKCGLLRAAEKRSVLTRFPAYPERSLSLQKQTRAKKLRHALLAMRSNGALRLLITVAVLTPSAKRPSRLQQIEIDGASDRALRDEAGLLKGRLDRFALYHYDQPEIQQILDRTLRAHAAGALSREMVDLSRAAQTALDRRGQGFIPLDLETLAVRHGLSRRLARQSARDPDRAVGLLCDLFAPVFLPALAAPQESAETPAISVEQLALTSDDHALLAQPPLAAPPLPGEQVSTPCRRGPWGPDEILDCTLRFRRGASLADLARLTGRSARAVRAQLLASGVLTRELTT